MRALNLINSIYAYLKGFLEIVNTQTPRYCFVIEKIDIVYQNTIMKTKIDYTPVGCYRPFRNFASELNDEIICRKFKPDHARIIISIDTLEKTLNLENTDHLQLYLNFVKTCVIRLKESRNA